MFCPNILLSSIRPNQYATKIIELNSERIQRRDMICYAYVLLFHSEYALLKRCHT